MTTDEVLRRLRGEPNLKRVSDESGVPYASLYRWWSGETENPGVKGIDKLRAHYERAERRPQ